MFVDSLGVCKFTSQTSLAGLGKAVEAATCWEGFTREEALAVGRQVAHLLRVFNLRCGIGPELEQPSQRMVSTAADGPRAGKSLMPHWDDLRRRYYELMGWDFETGRPLPETLEAYGLQDIASDIWR